MNSRLFYCCDTNTTELWLNGTLVGSLEGKVRTTNKPYTPQSTRQLELLIMKVYAQGKKDRNAELLRRALS